jgi:Flp pilus assembly protein TadG
MSQSGSKLFKSESGSLVPIFAVALVPMIAVVGLSVDYTSAVAAKASMQNALDAAALSITTLPTITSNTDRETKLNEAFRANGGQGTAKLDSFVVDTFGTASANVSASFAMPTNFMQIARVDSVQLGVKSAVRKTPSLVQATFKVDKISGYWDKTMTLYGTKFGETTANKLMKITYVHNKFGDPKGYGTSTVYTINGSTETKAQQQVCTTTKVTTFSGLPAGAITQTASNGQKYSTTCTNTFYPATNTAGAAIDVSLMNQLYLEMKIPNPNPGLNNGNLPNGTKTTLRSDDPVTSNRLYLDSIEVKSGQVVDIFTAVPCGQTSTQAWEDGGNAVPAAVSNADFFYYVTGKCDFNKRPSETMLTQ